MSRSAPLRRSQQRRASWLGNAPAGAFGFADGECHFEQLAGAVGKPGLVDRHAILFGRAMHPDKGGNEPGIPVANAGSVDGGARRARGHAHRLEQRIERWQLGREQPVSEEFDRKGSVIQQAMTQFGCRHGVRSPLSVPSR